MKYEFIRNHPKYPVTKWAALLKVSTSAYYDWLGSKDERDRRVQKYVTAIKELFEKSENTYGVDRICGCLRKRGYTASYKRVSRIMYELGLVSIHRRRRQRSLTDSRNSSGRELPNFIQAPSGLRHVINVMQIGCLGEDKIDVIQDRGFVISEIKRVLMCQK